MKRRFTIIAIICALGAVITSCSETQVLPKNVIVVIADGLGFSHVEASGLYENGATGQFVYEQFPVRLGMSTYSAGGNGYSQRKAASDFDYVRQGATDSGASATAMATGVKTYDGAIGVDMEKRPIRNMAERAKELGKAIGVVSSVEFTHATPAGFLAHNESRGNYEEIAREMFLDSRADLIMGAGHPLYDNDGQPVDTAMYRFVGGEAMWNTLVAGGMELDGNAIEDADGDGAPDAWTLIETREDFEALATGDAPARLVGIPRVVQTLQHNRSGDRKAPVPYTDPFVETVPTLETMTRGALNVLDADPDGLFLMIEAGAVDWASHGNSPSRMIEEMHGFNTAVTAVVEWVESHGGWDETLVIVTGDHETGYITGPGSGNVEQEDGTVVANYTALVDNGAGNVPGFQFNSGGHVNRLIPFYAKGAGSELLSEYTDEWDPNRGYFINNTEFAQLVFRLWE